MSDTFVDETTRVCVDNDLDFVNKKLDNVKESNKLTLKNHIPTDKTII